MCASVSDPLDGGCTTLHVLGQLLAACELKLCAVVAGSDEAISALLTGLDPV